MIRLPVRPVVLTGALALAMILSGCVSIPADGPVVDARRVEPGRGGVLQLLPAGPSRDAGPSELIREFLRAAAAFTNDHEVARSFLVPGIRLTWRPDSPVVVYPGEQSLSVAVTAGGPTRLTPTGTSPTGSAAMAPTGSAAVASSAPPAVGERATVTVRASVQARIDGSGQYAAAAAGDEIVRRFELVGTDQGWRISGLDNGILVTRYDFGITFRDLPVYFVDPTGTYLVPDVRWFPISGTTSTPSSLVSTMLAGPAAWLRPGVVTGAPPGTQSTVNAVKVAAGTATVDLNAAARSADPRARLMLKAQLEQSLGGLAQLGNPVTSTVVTVEQQRFELQPAPTTSPQARAAGDQGLNLGPPPQVDPRPVVLDGKGGLARLTGRVAVGVSGLDPLGGADASWPATDAAGQSYAVLRADRSKLVFAVPSGQPVTLMVGRDLVPPSFDPFGWVWSAQSDSRGIVLAGRLPTGVVRVQAPWLGGLRLTSIRISREGARAVVVAQQPGDGPRVYVCSVARTAQGEPTALGPPLRLLGDAQEATSAAWVDQTHVVVLARRPGSATMPWIVEIGGDTHATIAVQAVTVTAGNAETDLYVQAANGLVRSRVGSSWVDVPGVRWPAMPG